MDRRKFLISSLASLTIAPFLFQNFRELISQSILSAPLKTQKPPKEGSMSNENISLEKFPLPTIFYGHGSPMNAIGNNFFTQGLTKEGSHYQHAKGIIVISAHWITSGTQITRHERNPLIYDFYGFPDELYKIKYETKGSLQISEQISRSLNESFSKSQQVLGQQELGLNTIQLTEKWGLDHGAWTVLMHLFPTPLQCPVFQISLNQNWNLQKHFEFAQELQQLRKNGYLIIASGNIVHNLRQFSWEETAPTFSWAEEFDHYIKENLDRRSWNKLIEPDSNMASLWKQAHPSIDHYLPLIYTLGSALPNENLSYPIEGFQNGSISMRAVKLSSA